MDGWEEVRSGFEGGVETETVCGTVPRERLR